MMKLKKYYKIVNKHTGKEIDEDQISETIHVVNSDLVVNYDYKNLKRFFNIKKIRLNTPLAIKYKKLLPIDCQDNEEIITLQEGNTPLYKSKNSIFQNKYGFTDIYYKYEGLNPTGSFKDRGSMVEITKAIKYKAKGVIVASTGNMAASVAAYCAKAKIECFVFVPEDTPDTKLSQILFYGGKIVKIKGDYDEAAKLARKTSEEFNLYLAGDYVFRLEGQKSLAYEIIEQLNFESPDIVIMPTGNGTNISAVWKGFKEFKRMNIVKKLPKMVAVQIEKYNPIYLAKKNNSKKIKPIAGGEKTVASAIAVRNPTDGKKVVRLLEESKGFVVSVTDKETLAGQIKLASMESLFVEPSSATIWPALIKIVKNGKISKENKIVCILTGSGLKDSVSALSLLPKLEVARATLFSIKKIFSRNKWIS